MALTLCGRFCSNRSMQKYWQVIKTWFADWRAYLAEFLATFVFVFVVLAAFVVEGISQDLGILGLSLVTGFIYAAMVYFSVHLSGGFLNPAITLALWLVGKISSLKLIFFIIAQLLASLAAALLVGLVFAEAASQALVGISTLGIGVNLSSATLLEAILTGFLVLAVFATMVDRRGPVSFGPLALGLILTSLTAVSLPVSGGFLNISKAFGPAVIANSWETLAVWLIGPLAGSLFGLIYEFLFLKKKNR